MRCLFCRKGPAEGVTIFRINAKGQPGVWACARHRGQTDAPPVDPIVLDVVKALTKRARP